MNKTATSNASKIKNKFCPVDGRLLVFDKMVRHDYVCPQCGHVPTREDMGIAIRDIGITTVDGRVMNNPLYGVSGDGFPATIIPSGPSRSRRNKKLPLSEDDKTLVKQGYTILQITEHIGQPSKMLQPQVRSQQDNEEYDILDKFKRSRGGGIHGL